MPEKKKSKIGCFLKFLLIFFIIIGIILSGSYIFYLSTKEDYTNYIPDDYLSYVKVDSLTKVYNKLIDLRAADIILAQPKLKNAYKILLNYRSMFFTKNKFLSSILNMKVHMILKNNYSTVFLIDLGYKSILLRSAKAFTGIISKIIGNDKNIELTTIKETNYTIFKLTIKSSNQDLFFSVCKNLLFFGFSKEDIDLLYNSKNTGKNIKNSEEFNKIKIHEKQGSLASAFINTQDMINPLLKNIPDVNKYLKYFNFDYNSTVSVDISNDEVLFSTYTNCTSHDENIEKFLKSTAPKTEILNYLPINTNLCSSVSFSSFEELYKLIIYTMKKESTDEGRKKIDKMLRSIQAGSRSLVGLDMDEILFSWIGNEIGVFTTNISENPVIFLNVKNRYKLNYVIEEFINSIVMEDDRDLLYDGILLKKLKFPIFLRDLIYFFTQIYIDAPYYIIKNDYIFFSLDPGTLADVFNKYEQEQTLKNDSTFQSISSKIDNKSNIYLYFNLNKKIPKLLSGNDMITDILKLYEKGALTININNERLKLDIAAEGVNIRKTDLYPGYPKKLSNNIISGVKCVNIKGTSIKELVYITNKNELIAADINNVILTGFPCRLKGKNYSDFIIHDADQDGSGEIYVYTENGFLHKFNTSGIEKKPYPLKLNFPGTFQPVVYRDSIIFFSKPDQKMFLLKGKDKTEFDFKFEKPLLSPPSIYNDLFVFYPKDFDGTIYLTNYHGELQQGWPQKTGGVGYESPVFENNKILFITQSGNLNVFKINGKQDDNFPIKLEGVFYTQPVSGNISGNSDKEIVVLNKNGIIYILSKKGEILVEKKINDASGKDRKISLFDVNKDGKHEIFIYNGANSILAFNENLDYLPGFPVKGSTKPDFTDFNSDGQFEMVTAGIDDFLYIYTIPK